MATALKRAMAVIYALHGGPPIQKEYPEAASQTFKKGEIVYLDGSGNVAKFTAALDSGSQRILGIAAADGHNDSVAATHNMQVILGFGNVFEANVTSNGSDQVTAKTQIGTKYALYIDTVNNITAIDIANTGSHIQCARIADVSSRGAVGDTNGRVEFTFDPAALQVSGT